MKKLRCLLALALAAGGSAIFIPSAGATGSAQGPPTGPTTAPSTQCPAIGLDTSCEFLVDVTNADPASNPIVLRDSSQGFYDGGDDVTVAVQNDSSTPLSSIHLGLAGSGADSFGFDGDGLCNPPTGPSPEGCPFGPPGNNESPFDYYGPDAELSYNPEATDSGTVNFPIALQPGQYTYFALEANPFGGVYVTAGTANDAIGSTLTDTASSEVLPGPTIAMPAPANVTDQATINGPNALFATGKVTYRVYSDPGCTKEVFKSEVTIVTEGVVPSSAPVGEALPTNANYYWMVEYSGNAGAHPNSKNASYCGNELMTFGTPPVTAGTVSTSLVASNGVSGPQLTVPAGTAVHDTVAVAGQPQSGRVTYYMFSDPTCTSQIKTVNLGGGIATNGVFPASATVNLPVGTYYFQAAYSGGGGLAGSRSPCGSEVLTVVTPPSPPPPNSGFTIKSITSSSNGIVTITFIPTQSGEATLVVTVPTASIARVSAAAAKAKKCKIGQVKIRGKCRPNTTVAGKTSANGTAGVPLTLTVNLSSKIKARLKKGKAVHLTATLTYQSALGGAPTVETFQLTVKGKRPHHHKKH